MYLILKQEKKRLKFFIDQKFQSYHILQVIKEYEHVNEFSVDRFQSVEYIEI